MSRPKAWYIVKRNSGYCEILEDDADTMDRTNINENQSMVQRWGPFNSPDEAIARRIGLIRTGKCQPVQPTP